MLTHNKIGKKEGGGVIPIAQPTVSRCNSVPSLSYQYNAYLYRLLPGEDVSVSLAERLADRLDRPARARARACARACAHDELLAEGESHPRTRRRPDRQGQAGQAAGTWMWVGERVNGWVRTVDGCLVLF